MSSLKFSNIHNDGSSVSLSKIIHIHLFLDEIERQEGSEILRLTVACSSQVYR